MGTTYELGKVEPLKGVELTLAEAKAVLKMDARLMKPTDLFSSEEALAWKDLVDTASKRVADHEQWTRRMAEQRRR